MDEYLKLVDEVVKVAQSEATWEVKYALVFSDRLSGRLHELLPLDWNDPDMDYEDDVRLYVDTLREQAAEVRKAYT